VKARRKRFRAQDLWEANVPRVELPAEVDRSGVSLTDAAGREASASLRPFPKAQPTVGQRSGVPRTDAAEAACSEEILAGQLGGLADPARNELLVELLILMDVEVAHAIMLGLARGEWIQR
jgi:hypothetical protein